MIAMGDVNKEILRSLFGNRGLEWGRKIMEALQKAMDEEKQKGDFMPDAA